MPSDGSTVLFRRAGSNLDRKSLRDFANKLCEQVTDHRPFTCLITDSRELTRLNRHFLGKDRPTDVLSFPAHAEDNLGEIAISSDLATDQANQYGHAPDEEVKILMLHGVLHLLGMDHEKDRGAMARTETRLRRKFGLPSGLIERTRA